MEKRPTTPRQRGDDGSGGANSKRRGPEAARSVASSRVKGRRRSRGGGPARVCRPHAEAAAVSLQGSGKSLVSVCYSVLNKLDATNRDSLKRQKCILSQCWRPEARNPVRPRCVPSEGSKGEIFLASCGSRRGRLSSAYGRIAPLSASVFTRLSSVSFTSLLFRGHLSRRAAS